MGLALKLVNLVLIKHEEVLNRQSECLDDLTRLLRFARGHKLAELADVQEVAARLRELRAELLQAA